MIHAVAALTLVIGVPWLLRAFGVMQRSRDSMQATRRALGVVMNPELDDDEKERLMRRESIQLLRQSAILFGSGALAFALPLGLVWLGGKAGIVSFPKTIELALTWPYLAASIVAGFILLRQPAPQGSYSGIDRILHRFAFATRRAQTASADLEKKLMSAKLAAMSPTPAVFLTGLPRSGTTLLLEALAGLPEFATHTYRDMPFVLTPCLWQRLSAPFQHDGGKQRERAHGDGMRIGFDSPEAFEEVLWMTFHPGNYLPDRIKPWGDRTDPEFAGFMRDHMLKIRWLRRGECASRYLSKNNANISRIATLRRLDPDATILVPFREPLQHALSMLRQNLRFLEIHAEDPFAARYMAGIGHFEFGRNLRPIDFDGWLSKGDLPLPDCIDFWLHYWIAAYGHLVDSKETLCWIDYDSLCQSPQRSLEHLADHLNLPGSSRKILLDIPIRTPRPHEFDTTKLDTALLDRARELHAVLRRMAL